MTTFSELDRALKAHAEKSSTAEANRILERVTGTARLGDADPALYGDVLFALTGEKADDAPKADEAPDAADAPDGAAMLDANGNIDPAKCWARFNAAGRGRGRGRGEHHD